MAICSNVVRNTQETIYWRNSEYKRIQLWQERHSMRTIRIIALFAFIAIVIILLSRDTTSNKLIIDVDSQANPWTHLQIKNNSENFQFVVVADRTGEHRPGVFADAVKKINLMQPDFVMCVGDLIQGYTEDQKELLKQWDEFDAMVDQLKMPFFYLPGNHDITNNVMLEIWNQRLGRPYYHFVYRDVLFLCLDSEDPPNPLPHDTGRLSDEQLEYFANVLKQNEDVKWTFTFQHKPWWNRVYGKDDSNWEKLEAMLASRNYTAFAGHFHVYQKTIRNGQNHYILATTGGNTETFGVEHEQFDHVLWITVTDEGPKIVNLALDGIFDDEPPKQQVVTADTD